MSGKNQITGGAFQDAEGNRLSYGSITLQLSHDEQESLDPGQVVGGLPVKIVLDVNGNISGFVSVWPNDQLTPANSYYVVNAFNVYGELAWLSPQNFVIPSSPSPYDIGTAIPIGIPGTANTGVLLETNGVPNVVQNVLNLAVGGSGISLANVNGTTTITGSSSAPTVDFMLGAGFLNVPFGSAVISGQYPSGDSANEVIVNLFGLAANLTFNTISFAYVSGSSNTHVTFGLYSGPHSVAPGTQLWTSGTIVIPSFTSGSMEVAVTQLALTPGSYYLASTTDASLGGMEIIGIPLNGISIIGSSTNIVNHGLVTIGSSANPSTGTGTLPATLGTVTGHSDNNNTWAVPLVMFYKL